MLQAAVSIGIYWTGNSGDVMKVPLAGGPLTTLATGLINGAGIAVDATSVYWTINQADGVVLKLSSK